MQGCMHARKYIDMAHYFKKKKDMADDERHQRTEEDSTRKQSMHEK